MMQRYRWLAHVSMAREKNNYWNAIYAIDDTINKYNLII